MGSRKITPPAKGIQKIIAEAQPNDVLEALIHARYLAKVGDVISLFDFLCPEDTITSHTSDGRTIKR